MKNDFLKFLDINHAMLSPKQNKFYLILLLNLFFSITCFSQKITAWISYKTYTFELKEGILYQEIVELNKPSLQKISDERFSSISYDKGDVQFIQCTKTDGTVLAYYVGSKVFKEVLQNIKCNGKSYQLKANRDIYSLNPSEKIGSNAEILRNENSNLLYTDRENGKLYFYNEPANTWEEINQIVTQFGKSYVIKSSDESVWQIGPDQGYVEKIGSDCKLIISKEKTVSNVINILSTDGKFKSYDLASKLWEEYMPERLSASPQVIDPGVWFVLQNQEDISGDNMGLMYDDISKTFRSEVIPKVGSFDKFLWRTELNSNDTYSLFNKASGDNKVLTIAKGKLTFDNNKGKSEQQWQLTIADKNKYGTNAYELVGEETKLIHLEEGVISLKDFDGSKKQIWIAQPMDIVQGTRLPDNSDNAEYKDVYNKKLKIPGGPTIYGSNLVTDWSVLNAYIIVQNMINAVKDQQGVQESGLDNSIILVIGKDDSYPLIKNYPYLKDYKIVGYYRGLSIGGGVCTIFSEEMMCMRGVVNSFQEASEKGYRRFDHITHEFGHSLDGQLGWNGKNTIPSADNKYFETMKQELVAASVQAWFDCNSKGSYPGLPMKRENIHQNIYDYLKGKFNETNIWKPPYRLRMYPTSVQERLDMEESPMQIYNSTPELLNEIYGKKYQGGYIFFLDVKKELPSMEGLIAAPEDLGLHIFGYSNTAPNNSAANTPRANGIPNLPNLTTSQLYKSQSHEASRIGAGKNNSTTIMEECDTGSGAKECLNYSFEGYADWYLPSLEELYELYLRKGLITGLTTDRYWSSTQCLDAGNYDGWYIPFSSGEKRPRLGKDVKAIVRPIRSF